MATALKLKRDITRLKAALRSKATPKSFLPKLKSQLDKAETEYEAAKSGKKSAPKTTKQTKSTLDKLKEIIKKKKYGAYKGAGVDLKKDADRPALPTGKRISKNGNPYYEYRANRIDVKQPPKRYPKLEDGGEIYKDTFSNIFLSNGFSERKSFAGVKFFVNKKQKHDNKIIYSSVDIDNKKVIIEDEDGKIYYDGFSFSEVIETLKNLGFKFDDGMMAKGGETKPYIIWVSKDGEKRELHGTYKSQRAAEMAMKKLWDNGDYKAIGNKPKDMYEKEGFYSDGGILKEEDFVWNAAGKKLIVDKVTDDEYYLVGFGSPSPSPFSKQKIDNYIKSGEWTLKPKMEDGGMTPADISNQISGLAARIAELGNINTEAAYEETKKLMKMKSALEARALHLEDEKMAKGGEVKAGDILTANTGVKVKVVEYDPKFGGRVRVERMDEYATGKPSQFMPLSKFKYGSGGELHRGEDETYEGGEYMAKGGAVQHGLKKGDTITDDLFWENSVVVKNDKTGIAQVNLQTGERKELGK